MPVKNSMPYIIEAIKSFQKQVFLNKELIIVVTKSDDGTEFFLKKLTKHNIKIHFYNGGIYKCINYGIKKSTGQIIGTLNSDDIFYDINVLKKIEKTFKINKIDVCYGNIVFAKRENLNNIKRKWIEKSSNLTKKYWTPPHTSTFIKRKIFEKFNYNTSYKISSDTEFLLKLKNIKGIKFQFLSIYVCKMRLGGLSTKNSLFLTKLKEDYKIFKYLNIGNLELIKKILFKIKQFII